MPGFDAYDPAFVRDPYPTYARLRHEGPFSDESSGDAPAPPPGVF